MLNGKLFGWNKLRICPIQTPHMLKLQHCASLLPYHLTCELESRMYEEKINKSRTERLCALKHVKEFVDTNSGLLINCNKKESDDVNKHIDKSPL